MTYRHVLFILHDMANESYSLDGLAEATGIEARTIRSYIERGLLPGAQTRGRAATYSEEHLSRLQVIKSLRRARPNITLSEIRIHLQRFNPEQIQRLAGGSISAAASAIDHGNQSETGDITTDETDDERELQGAVDWEQAAPKLTGAERLVQLLREISGFAKPATTSKMEGWQRITVTPDIELSVRAEFNADQLAAFRDLADYLRHLLQRTDALSKKGEK